jgi:nuclear transport factor 2 (NTF2) superfamily protein
MMALQLQDFAKRYTAAWCSHDAARVAEFFSPDGSLKVNDAPPAVGREAIAAVASDSVRTFPDLKVLMDGLSSEDGRTVYRWTLIGTYCDESGNGNHVHISGYEEWRISSDGLIGESLGHFDEAEYQRQLQGRELGAP